MNCRTKSLLIVDEPGDSMGLHLLWDYYQCSDESLQLVLWQREGLFRLIPEPIIDNAICYSDYCKKRSGEKQAKQVCIRWEQGVDVDPKIARILLGE